MALIFLRFTDNKGCCDEADWAASHLDFNFAVPIRVNMVMRMIGQLWLYSHWVSGSLLVHNTSRLPHLGWLVCKGKTGRGNHYSSLLLLASDEALNPVCILELRGH